MRPTSQLDLFSEVLHSYSAAHGGVRDNASLYQDIAARAGLDPASLQEKVPVGRSGQQHNLLKRQARWCQQTLKHAGILTKVEGERGVWSLTEPAGKDLNKIAPSVAVLGYSTDLGIAILGACDTVFSRIDSPITLCLTSPPYCLAKARAYGSVSEQHYVDWICRQLENVVKNLVPGASVALNISNDIFVSGSPARSLYAERLLLALNDRLGLQLVDRLIWHNPSKPPGPVQWASINRVQLNVAYEPIYWLTNDPRRLRSDNRRVLQEHTERHLRLIQQGGEQRDREFSDGAYRIQPGHFSNATAGKIPRNVLTFGHSCSDQREYKRMARAQGLPAHGAPMPLSLASFLVEFMTEKGDLVCDPFAGSGTTGLAAERLGRRWLTTEVMTEYVLGSANRFRGATGFRQHLVA